MQIRALRGQTESAQLGSETALIQECLETASPLTITKEGKENTLQIRAKKLSAEEEIHEKHKLETLGLNVQHS